MKRGTHPSKIHDKSQFRWKIKHSISDINKSSLNSVVTNKSILDVEETVDNEDGEKKPEEVTKKITSDLV